MDNFVKLLEDGTLETFVPPLRTEYGVITNPSAEVLNQNGYYKYNDIPSPEPEEGHVVVKHGYVRATDPDLGEVIIPNYVSLLIVNEIPSISENQIILNIDNPEWVIDWDAKTKTAHYEVRNKVDNPPVLQDNQFVYEEHWVDDGENYTHVYDVWTLVDERPDDVPGHRVVEVGFNDDPETKTRTKVYVVKEIVDEKPADDPAGNYWWEFDYEEETDTQIIIHYKQVFKVWRIFSKLKLELALFKLNLLSKFDEILNGMKITNEAGVEESIRRFYDQANELNEGNEYFKLYYNQAREALGLTEEQGEQLLNACVADTVTAEEV